MEGARDRGRGEKEGGKGTGDHKAGGSPVILGALSCARSSGTLNASVAGFCCSHGARVPLLSIARRQYGHP